MKSSLHSSQAAPWSPSVCKEGGMKRLICTAAVLLALCVPARADDGLSMDEAMTRPMNVGTMYITDDGKTMKES